MRLLGYFAFIIAIAIAALELGGMAFAYLEGDNLNGVYPWSLLTANAALAPDNYKKAWAVVAAIPVLTILFVLALMFIPQRTGNHGSARFARPSDLRKQNMLAMSGVILGKTGKSKTAPLIRQDSQTHTLLAAPTNAGKNVSVIIPNLLTYGGSVICVDVKGENFEKTANARQLMGDRVFRFSPRALDGCSHRWNPLSYISTEPARRISELRQLSTYLFPVSSASADSWVKGARNIFVGICLYVLDHSEKKTIGAVYRALFGPYGFANSLTAILQTPNLDPECQRLLAQYQAFADDQLSGYIGSLEPLNLWSDPLVDAATSVDDFHLELLRRNPTSIYLAVASGEVEELAPLIRLFFQQAIDILQRSEPGPDEIYPVLMVMDEFRTLGKLEKVLSAITTIRSYGGRFMIVVQGLSNLVELYGRSGKDNFCQNCGFQVFFATTDETSSEYIRKRLGRKTVKQTSRSYGGGRTPTRSVSETGRDLMSVDEIARLSERESIILVESGWPVKANRCRWYEEKRFSSLVGPPPEIPELKTEQIMRPVVPPTPPPPPATQTKPPAEPNELPQAPAASGEAAEQSTAFVEGAPSLESVEQVEEGDRFSIARKRLDETTAEIEQTEVSWREYKADLHEGFPDAVMTSNTLEPVTTFSKGIDTKPKKPRIETGYDAPNVKLFDEITTIAKAENYDVIGNEMETINDIMSDLKTTRAI